MVLTRLLGGRWPQTVLFDLDGTLVDSVPDLAAAIDQMLGALKRPPVGESKVRLWVGNGAAMLVRRALAGGTEDRLVAGLEEAEVQRAMAIFFDAYQGCNGRHSRVYESVEPLLSLLANRGSRLGVVTNKPGRFTGPLLEQMGLAHHFGVMVSGDSLSTKKPDPAPLGYALEKLGGTAAGSLMVGDSVNDIQAARAAGMPVVAVSYGYNHGRDVREEGADLVVDSLRELL